MDNPPETLSAEQVSRAFHGGPDPRRAQLVVIGGRVYTNEGHGTWRLLDNRTYSTIKEMTDARP